jgi:hypothetical protein
VSINKFKEYLESEVQKVKHRSPVLRIQVREESNCVILESLREAGYIIEVIVLTIPFSLEKQIADNVRRLYREKVKDYTDKEAIHLHCDVKYKCDEGEMINRDEEIIGDLLNSDWANRIIDSL